MLRLTVFVLAFSIFGQIARAQSTCTGSGRFVDTVFSCVQVQKDIQYGTGVFDWSWGNLLCLNLNAPPYQTQLPLRLDWYEPCGDTPAVRPLVIAYMGADGARAIKKTWQHFAPIWPNVAMWWPASITGFRFQVIYCVGTSM